MPRQREVLVLNASWESLNRVSLHRALTYLVGERAEIVDRVPGRTVRAAGTHWPVPTIVRLVRYVRVQVTRRPVRCTRKGVLRRDGFRCAFCGRSGADTIDHVLPRSRGGHSGWLNLVAACRPCNSRKADRTPVEAGMRLLTVPRVPASYQVGWVQLTVEETRRLRQAQEQLLN